MSNVVSSGRCKSNHKPPPRHAQENAHSRRCTGRAREARPLRAELNPGRAPTPRWSTRQGKAHAPKSLEQRVLAALLVSAPWKHSAVRQRQRTDELRHPGASPSKLLHGDPRGDPRAPRSRHLHGSTAGGCAGQRRRGWRPALCSHPAPATESCARSTVPQTRLPPGQAWQTGPGTTRCRMRLLPGAGEPRARWPSLGSQPACHHSLPGGSGELRPQPPTG